jgi:tetratricopeptide (TPR) repeat protein
VDRTAWEEEAQSHFRQAGEAYAKAGEQTPASVDQADRLWMSASCFLDGNDASRAVPVLERLLKLDAPAERLGEAWLRLAEAEDALQHEAASQAAFRRATEYPGRGAAPARFHLAQVAIAKGELAVAETLLEENVDHANKDVGAEIAEKSLFALGAVHLQRRSLQSAILRLEQAMREYPNGTEMNQARYDLADCFRLVAQQAADSRDEATLPATRDYSNKQFRENLGKAAGQYQELADALSARATKQALTKDEEERYRLAAFASAQCRFLLGQFDEACKLYEGLSARYHDRSECLHALAGVAQCWWGRNDNKKAAIAVQALEKALRELDDTKFPNDPGAWDRKKWEAWIKEKAKPMAQP